MMDSGRPEDKIVKAEKLEELIELYRNIMAEAMEANPGLAHDPRIKEANDAVGGLSHGISLMASKEIPNSHAAAQQISADVTQTPEEWKHLHERAVDRLLDTMEGGLEAAISSIEEQDQAEERDAELAQDAIEASLMQVEVGRHKRRKKKQKSGMSAKKAQKINRDISADDRAAGQGRFKDDDNRPAAEHKKQISGSAYLGLASSDLDAIKALGTKLRNIGEDAKGMPKQAMDLDGDGVVTNMERGMANTAVDQLKMARDQMKGSRKNKSNKEK